MALKEHSTKIGEIRKILKIHLELEMLFLLIISCLSFSIITFNDFRFMGLMEIKSFVAHLVGT